MSGGIQNLTQHVNGEGGFASGQVVMRFNHQGQELFTPRLNNDTQAQFLRDMLTSIEAETVRRLYDPHDGIVLCPVQDDLAFGIKRVKHYYTSGSGKAGLIEGANPAINQVSAGLKEVEDEVYTFALGYEVDADQLAAAGRNDPQWDYVREHDMACQEGIQEFLDETLLRGLKSGDALLVRSMFHDKKRNDSDQYQLKGADGGYHLREAEKIVHIYAGLSAEVMANRLMRMVAALFEETNKTIRPNTLALPLRLRTLVESTIMPHTGMTVLQHVVTNSPYLMTPDDVIGVKAFENHFPAKGSKAALDLIAVYRRDPGVVRARIMSARRYGLVQLPFGQRVVWVGKMTPAQWKRPMGCLLIANDSSKTAE